MNRENLNAATASRAPAGAPNVLLVMLDDMGFGASSAFGGPCRMPTAERLGDDGLRYSRFHTTALCSPTRSALLTGRNHHSVGMGTVTNLATDETGYNAMRSPSKATLARTLQLNGWATGAFGKMHQTPNAEVNPAGPFTHWPTHEGFDRFYGFLGGETDQFVPNLVDGTTYVDPPGTEEEGYHFSEDLVDQACDWIRGVRTFDPDKPWFAYLPFGATHAPFHVPRSWREKYRGEFGHGWDEQRDRTLARQKELGIVPEDAELAPWADGAPHWDELSEDERLVAERLMEVYAAFAEHTDAQVGRLVDELERLGELDNTLVFYILGDNGASAEGGIEGTLNEMLRLNGLPDTTERILTQLDDIGGPTTYPHYNVGWALAMDTPYQWAKQVASHYGGTRNGLVVHWPEGLDGARGELRHQWHHVIDVVPTILEAAGLPHPTAVDGVDQDPIQGTSMLTGLRDAASADRHTTQYFEMHGNRGVYHEGWTAVTKHRTPWTVGQIEMPAFEDDVWELYDTTSDWTQARDVAAEHPAKLAELQALFTAEAEKYDVLPLDDRFLERLVPELSGRRLAPSTMTLDPSMGRLAEDAVPNIKNTSWRVSADVRTEPGADGVLVAQGGRFGGWSVFLVDGTLTYAHNYMGVETVHVTAGTPLTAGPHALEVAFGYDGGGLGAGGDVTLRVDGEVVGTGRLERTVPFGYSIVESLNVGLDWGTPVSERYSRDRGNAFTGGELRTVTIAVGDDAVQPSEAETLRSVMAVH